MASTIIEKPGATVTEASWNPKLYDTKHAFVWEKAKGVVELLAPKPGERILDLGCGTGHLTADIAASGTEVTGVDRSPQMIDDARRKFPGIRFELMDATALTFCDEFDAVFSNAALHWIPQAEQVVAGVARALKPGGRFVAEFGGKGNIAKLAAVIETVLAERGIYWNNMNPWFYPSIAAYASLLEKHGLEVREALLFDRPTALEDGERGLKTWLEMFGGLFLERIPAEVRSSVLNDIEHQARPALWKDGHWELDYRRLRVAAWKISSVREPTA